MPTVNRWLSFAGHQMLTNVLGFQANQRTECAIRNRSPVRFAIDTKPDCGALSTKKSGPN
jgi:hypothetical protein